MQVYEESTCEQVDPLRHKELAQVNGLDVTPLLSSVTSKVNAQLSGEY